MSEFKKTKITLFCQYWLPVILFCAFIFYQSSRPSPQGMPYFIGMDKLLHFTAYGLLGAMIMRTLWASFPAYPARRLILFSILAAFLYGIGDEIHQSFVIFRDGDVFDAIADFCGSVAGVLIYQRYQAAKGQGRKDIHL
jgi:VanZ family protein